VAGVSAPPYEAHACVGEEIQLFHTFDASSVFISSPGLLLVNSVNVRRFLSRNMGNQRECWESSIGC
jgi:hypothetical protein